jgi:hypothetical protein
MTNTTEKTKEIAHATVHPVETGKELAAEAEEGQSARTPAIVLTGVTIVTGAIVCTLLLIALLVYYLV